MNSAKMKNNKIFKSLGFSLVELIIYMGLSTVILTVTAGLFIAILESQTRSQVMTAMEQDSQYLLSKITYEIHQADEITIPISLGGQGSQLQVITSGQPISFQLNNQTLSITKNSVTSQLHSSLTQVTEFQISRLGNVDGLQAVSVLFNLESLNQTTGGAQTKQYQTTVSLR